ncbi:MAG TPA: pyridoxal-phosphate dependent enzyme, partial [Candidatus Altiarchaeales archaeon]|nr:pyridoxal-phosphate dependent enzyme [Candidatus Altiarchaeales archaeon]
LPDIVFACVGGGSNAMGIFYDFIKENVKLIGVEAGGRGIKTGKHGATLCAGTEGVLHGMYTKLLQDKYGQIKISYSISAGLDYPGVGPELVYLLKNERIQVLSATDKQALNAFKKLSENEGIIPALESSHALYHAFRVADKMNKEEIIVVNLSGRGDKDVFVVAEALGVKL